MEGGGAEEGKHPIPRGMRRGGECSPNAPGGGVRGERAEESGGDFQFGVAALAAGYCLQSNNVNAQNLFSLHMWGVYQLKASQWQPCGVHKTTKGRPAHDLLFLSWCDATVKHFAGSYLLAQFALLLWLQCPDLPAALILTVLYLLLCTVACELLLCAGCCASGQQNLPRQEHKVDAQCLEDDKCDYHTLCFPFVLMLLHFFCCPERPKPGCSSVGLC